MNPTQVKLIEELIKNPKYSVHINIGGRLGVNMPNNMDNEITKVEYSSSSLKKRFATATTPRYHMNLFNLSSEELQIVKKGEMIKLKDSKEDDGLVKYNNLIYYKVPFEETALGDFALVLQDNKKVIGIILETFKSPEDYNKRKKPTDMRFDEYIDIPLVRVVIPETLSQPVHELILRYNIDVQSIKLLM